MPSNAETLSPSNSVTRRSFLTLAWKGLLGLSGLFGVGGLLRFLAYQPEPPPSSRFDLGFLEDYPPSSRTPIPAASALVIATPDGLKAYSLVCPHLGCQVGETDQGFTCPCHGSSFLPDGELTRGPAKENLKELHIETDPEGRLTLIAG